MRRILINNETEDTLFVKYLDNCYEINSGCNMTLEFNENNSFRVYKKKSSRLCIGQFFSREELRNVWIFGPMILINLDSLYDVPNGVKRINITEKKCKSTLFTVFCMLLFNDTKAEVYDFHRKTDRIKLKIFNSLFLLPLAILCFLLVTGCIYGISEDFSLETVVICLFCLTFIALFIRLAKSVLNSIRINKTAIKMIDNYKSINILKDMGWLIKYYEL